MNASDVMNERIISIAFDTPARRIIRIFRDHQISGAPVLDAHGALVGVVSMADCVLEAERGATVRSRGFEFHHDLWCDLEDERIERAVLVLDEDCIARDLMTPEPYTVAPETPIAEVVDLMSDKRIHRVMVASQGKLLGIVTTVDIMKALAADLPRRASK